MLALPYSLNLDNSDTYDCEYRFYKSSSEKNLSKEYKSYISRAAIFGTMDLEATKAALKAVAVLQKFRRISRRQASQLPRWCDIPAAWALKSTPFFLFPA
jgi:hypothetical protein